jgi:hypothetical protein
MAGPAQRTTARKASGEPTHDHNTAGARAGGLRRRAWRLNYSISRAFTRHGHRYFDEVSLWLMTSMDYDSPTFHARIKARIMRLNPGWILEGYCPATPRS